MKEREGSRPGKRDIGPTTDFFLGTFWEGREREADSEGSYRATDKFLSQPFLAPSTTFCSHF